MKRKERGLDLGQRGGVLMGARRSVGRENCSWDVIHERRMNKFLKNEAISKSFA